MVCGECGAEIDESANFCAKCGARIEKKAEVVAVADENKDVARTAQEESCDVKKGDDKLPARVNAFMVFVYGSLFSFATYVVATVEVKWYLWIVWAYFLFMLSFSAVKASQGKCHAGFCFNDPVTHDGLCAECDEKRKDGSGVWNTLKELRFPGEELSEEEEIEPKVEKAEQKKTSKKEGAKSPDESGCGCIIAIVLVLLFGGTFMGLLFDLVLGISLLSLFF